MKRYILALTLLLVSGALFAYCPTNIYLSSNMNDFATGLSPTVGNISARLWIQGNADWTTLGSGVAAPGTCTLAVGGCDSDGVPAVDTTCAWLGNSIFAENASGQSCQTGTSGGYYLSSDWSTTTFDGCPATGTSTTRAVVLVWDTTGAYALGSRSVGQDWGDWDPVGTIAAAPLSIATGTATYEDVTPYTVDIAWDNAALAGIAYGHYGAGDAPSSTLITGFRTYFLDSAAAPASFAIGSWTAGTLYAYGAANLDNFVYPTPANPATNSIYMSRSIIIDGIELPFVSTNYITLYAPSGAPAISGLSAVKSGLNTLVSWTSGDESQVTGYQVFWAPQGGQFSAVGSIVSPTGNNSDYTASVRIPATSSFTVKVGAHLTNGSVTYSAATNVKATNIIKDKTRVNVN